MDRNQIREEIIDLVARYTKVFKAAIEDDMDFYTDLAMDGVDMDTLIYDTQVKFEVDIKDEEAVMLGTVGDLVELIVEKKGEE